MVDSEDDNVSAATSCGDHGVADLKALSHRSGRDCGGRSIDWRLTLIASNDWEAAATVFFGHSTVVVVTPSAVSGRWCTLSGGDERSITLRVTMEPTNSHPSGQLDHIPAVPWAARAVNWAAHVPAIISAGRCGDGRWSRIAVSVRVSGS